MGNNISEEKKYNETNEDDIKSTNEKEEIETEEEAEEIEPEEETEDTGETEEVDEEDTGEIDVEEKEETTEPPKEVTRENKLTRYIYNNRTMIKITTIAMFILLVVLPSKMYYMTGYKYRLPKDYIIAGININEEEAYIKDPDKIDVLINRELHIQEGYEPDINKMKQADVKFRHDGFHEKKLMRIEAANELERMFKEAIRDGNEIIAVSGYRSYKTQYDIFISKVKSVNLQKALETVAIPGSSEHQLGLAMDVTSKSVNYKLVGEFGRTDEGKWLAENSHRYGYIIRYPEGKEDITGYRYEPWHLRYVGKEIAEEIYSKGITLEEYNDFEIDQFYLSGITYDNIGNLGIDVNDLK